MNADKYNLTRNNLTIVFKNVFNKKIIEGLEQSEHNLLLGLLGKLKEKGLKEVSISFAEVSVLMGQADVRPQRVNDTVLSLWDKIKMTDYTLYAQGPKGLSRAGGVMLFSHLKVDKENNNIKLKMNPDLAYFVNSFDDGNFVSLELKQFIETRNKHGKNLFRLLSQYKRTGFFVADRDTLFYLMCKPKSYDIRRFHSLVLGPAIKSIESVFENLTVNKIKKGRRIVRYEFHFTPRTEKNQLFDPGFQRQKALTRDSAELISPDLTLNKNNKEAKTEDFIQLDLTEKVLTPYENNFENGYIPGQNSPTTNFKSWLKHVNFFKINDEYFDMRSTAKKALISIYKEKVIDNKSKAWTDMRFFASVYSIIKNNKAMTSWNIEDAYAEIRGGKRLNIPQEVYRSLPEDKVNELFEFTTKGEVI